MLFIKNITKEFEKFKKVVIIKLIMEVILWQELVKMALI